VEERVSEQAPFNKNNLFCRPNVIVVR